MSLRAFYLSILSVLATIAVLSLAWEFWLEDVVLPFFRSGHATEDTAQRWEFVVTAVVFSAIALVGPTVVGARIIRRAQTLQAEVSRLSQEDHLTGLSNRRRITQLLEQEIRRVMRCGDAFSVILIDIDHFKSVNDQFGHQVGDAVLKKIADVIRTGIRASDAVGRWGGEEFMVLLPQTDTAGGISLAEKLLRRIETTDFGEVGHRTASFGVASFDQSDDIESLVARADAGLYAAKKRGRNRIGVVAVNDQVNSETEDDANSRRIVEDRAAARS
jgi:diguanylate cyclase (GGDEF)-like protein